MSERTPDWMNKMANDLADSYKKARERGYNGFPCNKCGEHDTRQVDGFAYGDGPGSVWCCNKCRNTFTRRY